MPLTEIGGVLPDDGNGPRRRVVLNGVDQDHAAAVLDLGGAAQQVGPAVNHFRIAGQSRASGQPFGRPPGLRYSGNPLRTPF